MALGVSDHDQRSGLHPANADVALLAVVPATVGRRCDPPLEDSPGGVESDTMLADFGLILGLVPLEFHWLIIHMNCSYINSGCDRRHPGGIARLQCVEPLGLTVTRAADGLGVTRQARTRGEIAFERFATA